MITFTKCLQQLCSLPKVNSYWPNIESTYYVSIQTLHKKKAKNGSSTIFVSVFWLVFFLMCFNFFQSSIRLFLFFVCLLLSFLFVCYRLFLVVLLAFVSLLSECSKIWLIKEKNIGYFSFRQYGIFPSGISRDTSLIG